MLSTIQTACPRCHRPLTFNTATIWATWTFGVAVLSLLATSLGIVFFGK